MEGGSGGGGKGGGSIGKGWREGGAEGGRNGAAKWRGASGQHFDDELESFSVVTGGPYSST